jgi:hypothetical protein
VTQNLRVAILAVVSIFWVAWAVITLVLQRQFVSMLRTNQPKLWHSLWDPAALPLFQFRYSYWFWTGGFDQAGDTELSRLGTRCYAASFILGCTFGLWIFAAWFFGLMQLR